MPLCTESNRHRHGGGGAPHPLHNISKSLHHLMSGDSATYLTNLSASDPALILSGATDNSTDGYMMVNNKEGQGNPTSSSSKEGLPLNELQLIKAVVLIIVVAVLLLSTCRVIFKTFLKIQRGHQAEMIMMWYDSIVLGFQRSSRTVSTSDRMTMMLKSHLSARLSQRTVRTSYQMRYITKGRRCSRLCANDEC